MDMEYYRNFIAIVEAGSLSAASKRVHVAQPALSNQLKLLQKKFGTQLVNIRRGVHNIELTNAGCILYNKAKYLCSLEDDTQREISDCVNGYTGTLRVSLSPSMSISFIQTYLSKFSKEYPQINYELYEVSILEQINQMLTGKTEIGVANAPLTQESRFDTIYTKQERLVAVMHKDNPWLPADDKALLLAHMEDMPICLSRGCSTLFLNVCSDSMIFPQILSINSTKLSTIAWAKENVASSCPDGAKIRFLVDDVSKLVQREIRRGNQYDGIIMDPPSYGRGPSGEVWKVEEGLFRW